MFQQLSQDAHYKCNATVLQYYPDDGRDYCPAHFDGFGCWNHTLAGHQAIIKCPDHIRGIHPNRFAYRNCTEDATWLLMENSSFPLVDYSKCFHTQPMMEEHPPRYGTYGMFIGYSLSIILLTIAELIFFSFKQLRCDRITLHKNLFATYIMSALAKIIYLASVTFSHSIMIANPVMIFSPRNMIEKHQIWTLAWWVHLIEFVLLVLIYKTQIWCRVLQIIGEYAIACNFGWMLCEGFYLHTVLVWPFHTGKKLIYLCCGIGWGIPIMLTLFYAIFRFQSSAEDTICWLEKSDLQWIIDGPICFSILLNIYFLCAIVFVLLTKLRGMSDNSQTRKVFRATMILVPLLGLQFLLTGFHPGDPKFLEIYHIFTNIAGSLQGTFVAIMYCFCDREALSVIKRWYNQQKEALNGSNSKRASTYITMYTDPLTASNSTKTVDAEPVVPHSKVAGDAVSTEETVEMLTSE